MLLSIPSSAVSNPVVLLSLNRFIYGSMAGIQQTRHHGKHTICSGMMSKTRLNFILDAPLPINASLIRFINKRSRLLSPEKRGRGISSSNPIDVCLIFTGFTLLMSDKKTRDFWVISLISSQDYLTKYITFRYWTSRQERS